MAGEDLDMADISAIQKRAHGVRERQRTTASQVVSAVEDLPGYTGTAFVEQIGAMVTFDRGEAEFYYPPAGLEMRDHALKGLASARERVFAALASQLRAGSRVIVVGAGGDILPIQCLVDAGHDVLATDFSLQTVEALRRRIDVAAFAGDLAHLSEVLPSVDYVLGNSVLGYVDPRKLRVVVDELTKVIGRGAVFTFDQTPHPAYFDIGEAVELQTLVNPSAACPRRLLKFVKRFGAEQGVAAMAEYQYTRAIASHLAMLETLRRLFGRSGLHVVLAWRELLHEGGARSPMFVVRVARGDDEPVLALRPEEFEIRDFAEVLTNRNRPPYFMVPYIDRDVGEELAVELGIRASRREAPWRVARHIQDNQPGAPDAALAKEVAAELDPMVQADRIMGVVDGRVLWTSPPKLPTPILKDQTLHKLVLVEGRLGPDEADAEIDMIYARHKATQAKSRRARSEQQKKKAARRKSAKQRKQKRKGRK